MDASAGATISEHGGQLAAAGDWTLANAVALQDQMARIKAVDGSDRSIDASAISRMDTSGATLLLELANGTTSALHGLGDRQRRLLDAVATVQHAPRIHPKKTNGLVDAVASVGAATLRFRDDAFALLGFIGQILETLARTILQPRRWRMTSLVAQIEQTGLNAVPIVALLSFLIGCVIAFLGATVLRDFGATLFTVELVSYSFLREFGVLLTAIMIAGRSGSAFTASIGSMKSREEIDAIRTLALDPIEVLVLPRTLALLVSLPLLTFVGMVAGIVGGGVVCALVLDISPTLFITRFHETTAVKHFWVGMSKAPIFAFLIAAIGCLEGFKVSGSAESVGAHTTSSVVQSIFVVILIDAMAAIFCMELGV
ncbi:MAG: MlaE family lipid ABC transporter permease subunit [Dokdonella sp.]